jgi:putative transposase
MARRLRIQYPGAIYHVMARGNARQDIVGDDADRRRLLAALEQSVRRSGWVLYAFVFMTNHLHLVLKTPRANLATGMQLFLSSYATWWARRHRACEHLLQGRYRTELVEDETYLLRGSSTHWRLRRETPGTTGFLAASGSWTGCA